MYTFNSLKRNISLLHDILIIYQLYKFIKAKKYHIVDTHSAKAGVVGRVAAWLAKTPIIIHHNHAKPYNRYQSWYVRSLFQNIEKTVSFITDKVVSVSHTIVEEMVADKIVQKEKFIVIRSGFDMDNFINFDSSNDSITRQKYGIKESDIILGKIGRLSLLKGHIYLLEAFKKISIILPNLKLLLVGSGESKSDLIKYIEENQLDEKVIFTGLVSPIEIPKFISIMDIVAHTSLTEGLPRVFPQSMLMGKPVISFDLDGAHEIIIDGKNGYLIEPLNIEMLSERILDLSSNLKKAKMFGEYAKNNIGDDFSIKKMVENNYNLYESLLKKN